MKFRYSTIAEIKARAEKNLFVIEQHFMLGNIEIDAAEKGAILIWNFQEAKKGKAEKPSSEEKTTEVIIVQDSCLKEFITILTDIDNDRKHKKRRHKKEKSKGT